MTELFHTDLDDAAMYKARLAEEVRSVSTPINAATVRHKIVRREYVGGERLRVPIVEVDADVWARLIATGDALAAAVESEHEFHAALRPVGTNTLASECPSPLCDAARAWREARE